MNPLILKITLKSDALFGAGYGTAGATDIEAELDPDTGLPFLRGRTLKGLLVEACANILYSANGHSRLQAGARFLFGEPGSDLYTRARMRVGKARLSNAILETVTYGINHSTYTREDVIDALTTIRRQTAIDNETGAPKNGSLRSARLVRRDLTFYAPLHFTDEPSDDALTLLAACARAVHRGGTNRTRGMGKIHIVLCEVKPDPENETRTNLDPYISQGDFRTRFETLLTSSNTSGESSTEDNNTGTVLSPAVSATSDSNVANTAQAIRAIRYRITLEESVLIQGLEGDPNSAVGFDHIPGASLRGAFIGRYLRNHPVSDLAGDQSARALFFDGGIRFLNAYPVVEETRAVPSPRSLFRDKGLDTPLFDFALNPDMEQKDGKQWRRLGKPYVYYGSQAHGSIPQRSISLHIQRTRRTVTKGNDDRAIFYYDALKEGQTFEGVLLCDSTTHADIARGWIDAGQITLGGSTSAGYGLCTLEFQDTEDWEDQPGEWPGVTRSTPSVQTISLLSPLLIRDPETGLHTTNILILEKVLNEALGFTVTIKHTFTGEQLVAGFNRKWGLPLPQQRAFAAGSVFVVEFTSGNNGAEAKTSLQKLERDGLGDRLTEGFGRLAVNRIEHKEMPYADANTLNFNDTEPEELSDEEARAIKARIKKVRCDREIDGQILRTAQELSNHVGRRWPVKSQLSRAAQAFRSAMLTESVDSAGVTGFLDDLPQHARRQFEKHRIGGNNLLSWLKDRANGRGQLDSILDLDATTVDTLSADNVRRSHLKLAYTTLTLAAKKLRDTDT